jgi:adenylate cyclase
VEGRRIVHEINRKRHDSFHDGALVGMVDICREVVGFHGLGARRCAVMKWARQYPVESAARALLVSGAIVPTVVGAAVIATMAFWALPTSATDLSHRHVLSHNVIASLVYLLIAVPIGVGWGYFWLTIPASTDATLGRRTLLAVPPRIAVIHGTVWFTATLLFVVTNIRTPWLATTLGVSMLLGGTVTMAVSYWMCRRVLRPSVAVLLTEDPPRRPRRPGLRLRAVSAWVVGSGVPMLMLMLVAASSLVVEYPGHRLAVVVLALGACAVISGFAVAAFTAATTADPIDEVRRGMERVERGDFDVAVPVFDASELGLLQAGFNFMAKGLRERERLRDLFGRHVGRDVARLAEESASEDGSKIAMSGVNCEVAVLFVDLVGSTTLATKLPPEEVVQLLNGFFIVVVEVVERRRGLVNKFEGDAALAIFGAPMPLDDPAGEALAAAREMNNRLNPPGTEIRAGIGVSAGVVVAGNVGDPSRYEYTVIGDPVNEAARLTDVAKRSGGVVASGAALTKAKQSEVRQWRVIDAQVLRGRDSPTEIAVPAD